MSPEKPIIVRMPLPRAALPIAIKELAAFGAVTEELTSSSGKVRHMSGHMSYHYDGDEIVVEVVKHSGHFPRRMIIGGIRQALEEAAERARKL